MKLKAIDTVYKGYRFRSRLEARWAVFFDAMNEEWEYEVQGYDLSGVLYLPDFFLPRLNCFLEVKGTTPTEEELNKAYLLQQAAQKAVAIFHGLPTQYWGTLYCWDESDGSAGNGDWNVCLCNDDDGYLTFGTDWPTYSFRGWWTGPFEHGLDMKRGFYPTAKTTFASVCAKQARFEHGQSGI